MQRVLVAIVLLTSVSAPARADRRARDAGDVVAILPFTTADDSLAIYSKAAAAALGTELRGLDGVRVETVSLSDSPPAGVALVIDGRIVAASDGASVSVELTVRDPVRGVAVGTVSSRVAPLEEIDALVADTARRARAVLGRALAESRSRRAEQDRPIRLRPTVVEGERTGAPAGQGTAAVDDLMMVLPATGAEIGGVAVGDIATGASRDLARRLGFRPLASGIAEVTSHRDAAALAAKAGASAVIKVHVKSVDFDWVGVLTARATVRVALTLADGTVAFDRTVRTDTVVGSRGDRHAAIVRMACDQAMDIAAPPIRRFLGSR